jgi:6-phosphofructokinase 1
MRTLLIVSGGDSPGINTALYRFSVLAEHAGDQVVGAIGGFEGAVAGHLVDLRSELLAPFVAQGGSYLASSRLPIMNDPLNRVKLVETISRLQINNIVLFGGDGTLRHLPPILADMGIACIGIPTTIDNDVPGTQETIGFDTACNAAHSVIDGLLATGRALPGRIFSVETLGGHTGFLALAIAYSVGASAVLIPEFEFDMAWLVERLKTACADGMALLILSEGVQASRTLMHDFQEKYGLRVRDTRLGHGQRGAAPSYRDRALAFRMIDMAHQVLHDGATAGTIVVGQNGQLNLCEDMINSLPMRQPDRQCYEKINHL